MEVFQMTILSKLREVQNLLFIHMVTEIHKVYLSTLKQEFYGSTSTVPEEVMKLTSQKKEKIMDGQSLLME